MFFLPLPSTQIAEESKYLLGALSRPPKHKNSLDLATGMNYCYRNTYLTLHIYIPSCNTLKILDTPGKKHVY